MLEFRFVSLHRLQQVLVRVAVVLPLILRVFRRFFLNLLVQYLLDPVLTVLIHRCLVYLLLDGHDDRFILKQAVPLKVLEKRVLLDVLEAAQPLLRVFDEELRYQVLALLGYEVVLWELNGIVQNLLK